MSPILRRRHFSHLPRLHKTPGVWLCTSAFSVVLAVSSCAPGKQATNDEIRDEFSGRLEFVRSFGKFVDARAISLDAFGNCYIVDAGTPGVFKYDSTGKQLRTVVGLGTEHERFDEPCDIDASLTNIVAIADRNNHRIEIFSKDLIWLTSIGGHDEGSKIYFGYPSAVRAAQSGNYFIIDGENKRALSIQPVTGSQQILSRSGAESGSALDPIAITVAGNEYVTVADRSSGMLMTFNNALLLQSAIQYPELRSARLTTFSGAVLVYSPSMHSIRTFSVASLRYVSTLRIPPMIERVVAVAQSHSAYYILTKENVVVCSTN